MIIVTYPGIINITSPTSWVYNPNQVTDYRPNQQTPSRSDSFKPTYPIWVYHPLMETSRVVANATELNALLASDSNWQIQDNFVTSKFGHNPNPSPGPPRVINTIVSTAGRSIIITGQPTAVNMSNIVATTPAQINVTGNITNVTGANPNLVVDCLTFNTTNWVIVGAPSFSATLVTDPNGTTTAQRVTLADPRCGFYQIIAPPLAPGTYTLSLSLKLFSGTPAGYLGYFNGSAAITQYSSKITATGSWVRTSFTITVAAGDPSPSVGFFNANVDGASQGNVGVVDIWGFKCEVGSIATSFSTCAPGPTVSNPNLINDCSTFNTANWNLIGLPTFNATLVTDPDGGTNAQQVTLVDPRSGFYQVISPAVAAGTYTISLWYKLLSGTPAFYFFYYNGSAAVTQYSTKITPTGTYQRTSFTITITAGDAAPSVGIVNANVDGASQGNVGTVALYRMKLEVGMTMTAVTNCANTIGPPPPPPPPGTRAFALSFNPGSDLNAWAGESAFAAQRIDMIHGFTAEGDTSAQADGSGTWNPAPHAYMITAKYCSPTVHQDGDFFDLVACANGTYDSFYQQCFSSHSSIANKIAVVRIWQECNGNWFPWGRAASTAQFIAAWRRIATICKQVLPNAKIEWNLNEGGPFSGSPSSTGFDLYPGDDLVDVVGIDSYERFANPMSTAPGFGVTGNNILAFARAHGKLVGVSEWASWTCNAQYITDTIAFFDSMGSTAAYVSYYDQGRSNNGGDIMSSTSGTDSCGNTIRNAWNATTAGTQPYGGTWSTVL